MNPSKYLRAVSEFHAAMLHRQPEPKAPDLEDIATNRLRPELMIEELLELTEAVDESNRLEQLDALCDFQYVLSGSVLDWGLRVMFETVPDTVTLVKIPDLRRHVAKMIGIVKRCEVDSEMGYIMQLLGNLKELQSLLCRAVFHLGFFPVFDEAFATVHANNLGKIWSEAQMRESRTKPGFLEEMGVDAIDFTKSPKGWIARRGDGKILKPLGFSKVSLEKFV